LNDGIELESRPDRTPRSGISMYVTSNESLAAKYAMQPESELTKEGN